MGFIMTESPWSKDTIAGDPPHAEFVAGDFEDFASGFPNAPTLSQIREGYRAVIKWRVATDYMNLWGTTPWEVARCAVMGVDPYTGADLENPEAFLQNYKERRSGFRNNALAEYYRLLQNRHVQQAIAAEAAKKAQQ